MAVPEGHHREADHFGDEGFEIRKAIAALNVHANILILELLFIFVILVTVNIKNNPLPLLILHLLLPLPEHLVYRLRDGRVLLVYYIHAG